MSCLDGMLTGPVGDLSAAAASGDTGLSRDDAALLDVLRCLRTCSLCWRVMRMDRLTGAISSPPDDAFDFERVCRAGLSTSPSPSRVRGPSLSESDVTTVDVKARERERREALVDCG